MERRAVRAPTTPPAIAHSPPWEQVVNEVRWSDYRERLRTSLWPVPGMAALGAVVAAKLLALLDREIAQDTQAWYLFGGQPESARELLSTIASSLLTFTALVFSITILVLQLASSQFSPRVLRTFLQDTFTKSAMGVFIGSFVYALALLPEIRNSGDEGEGFVPALSVFLAFLLTLLSVFVFIRYIHQMAHSIRVVQILRRVGHETRRSIVSLYPDEVGEDAEADTPERPSAVAQVVTHAGRGGVLASIDEQRLLAAVERADACAELLHEPGTFVPEGAPLYRVWNARDPEDVARELAACTSIAAERTPEQDPAFGFRQLVDVAERALSPGVNDPTTAVQALDQLHDLLRALSRRRFPASARLDAKGRLRLILPRPSWDAFVQLAFDEIRFYGRDSLQVKRRLRAALEDLLSIAPPDRRAVLTRQLQLVEQEFRREARSAA
jgi:uncharacterized membrane protein